MSKIVCDVCGSSYAETETQCPICGTAKAEAAKPIVETTMEQPKVGKYSKNNTKKTASASRPNGNEKSREARKDGPSNTAMIAIVAVLLLAIVAVCVFIAVRLLDGRSDIPGNTTTTSSATSSSITVPCTGIEIAGIKDNAITLTGTEAYQLVVNALPGNTTENVTFTYESSDPAIVLVDKTGKITPVANGKAKITVSYNDFKAEVDVTVELPEPEVTLELIAGKDDITLNASSSSYNVINLLKNSAKLDKDLLIVTSADESVVRVDGTKIIAVSNNSKGVVVTISYGEQSVETLVRVSGVTKSDYYLSRTDITLTLGKEGYESFELSLIGKDGNAVKDVQWKFSNDFPKCCEQKIDAETGIVTITAKAVTSTLTNGTYVKVYTTYDGVKYECIIRVNGEAQQG